jgi:hypothetical protein
MLGGGEVQSRGQSPESSPIGAMLASPMAKAVRCRVWHTVRRKLIAAERIKQLSLVAPQPPIMATPPQDVLGNAISLFAFNDTRLLQRKSAHRMHAFSSATRDRN